MRLAFLLEWFFYSIYWSKEFLTCFCKCHYDIYGPINLYKLLVSWFSKRIPSTQATFYKVILSKQVNFLHSNYNKWKEKIKPSLFWKLHLHYICPFLTKGSNPQIFENWDFGKKSFQRIQLEFLFTQYDVKHFLLSEIIWSILKNLSDKKK